MTDLRARYLLAGRRGIAAAIAIQPEQPIRRGWILGMAETHVTIDEPNAVPGELGLGIPVDFETVIGTKRHFARVLNTEESTPDQLVLRCVSPMLSEPR